MEESHIDKIARVYHFISDFQRFHENLENRPLSEIFSDIYGSVSWSDIIPTPKVLEDQQWLKSLDDSARIRIEGNVHYMEGNLMKALKLFTQAVGKAHENSIEIALAYANRSAVTYHLGEFENCLIDIKHVFDSQYSKYPEHLVYKLNERKGDCLVAINDINGAISAFESALTSLNANDQGEEKVNLETKKNIEQKIKQAKNKRKATNKKQHSRLNHVFELSHSQSATIICASKAVKIEFAKEMGRMVVANMDIKPGDVLAIERPSACIPEIYEYMFCDYCLKRCHSSVPCTHCSRVFFCNEDCREKSWKQSHEIECILFPLLISMGFEETHLLAVRSFILMTNQGKNLQDNAAHYMWLEKNKINSDIQARGFVGDIYPSGRIETSYYLETCEDKRDKYNILSQAVSAVCVFNLLKTTTFFDSVSNSDKSNPGDELTQIEKTTGGILLNFIMIAEINFKHIYELTVMKIRNQTTDEFDTIGAGLYNFISLFNHSCDPNVVKLNDKDNAMVLVAIKNIKKGEQLFDCYGPSYVDHKIELRQFLCDSVYFFKCKCTPCTQNWPMQINLPPDQCLKNMNPRRIKQLDRRFLKICFKINSGNVNVNHLPFLYSFLTEILKTYKMPSGTYNMCQSAIYQCLLYQGNCYYIKP